MTCVIAAQCDDGTVIMGADHAFTMTDGVVRLGGLGQKVRVAKNFLIGYTGHASIGSLVLNHLENEELKSKDDEMTVFEISDLVNSAYSELNIAKVGNITHFLVAYRSKIFRVYTDLICQMSIDNVDAVGTDPTLFRALYRIHVAKTNAVLLSITQTILDASIICPGVKCFDAGPTIVIM